MSAHGAARDALAARCEAVPYHRSLGLHVTAVESGMARLRLPYADRNANRNGTLHGGVSASLVAAASALAVAEEALAPAAPADLHLSYLAVGRAGEDVTAEARVLRRGTAIAHVEAVVLGPAGQPLVQALVVERLVEGPPSSGTAALAPVCGPLDQRAPAVSPFSKRLGVGTAVSEAGRGVAVLPAGSELCDLDGRIHAGALATLFDAASGASVWTVAGVNPRARAATLALRLAVHAPVRGEDVVAEALTVAASGEVLSAMLRCFGRASGTLVATGAATYRIGSRS